jgi:predicted ATPase
MPVTAADYPEDPFAAFRGLYGPRARRQALTRRRGHRSPDAWWAPRAVQQHIAVHLINAPGGHISRGTLRAAAPDLPPGVAAKQLQQACRWLERIGAAHRAGDRVVITDRAKLAACLPTPVEGDTRSKP